MSNQLTVKEYIKKPNVQTLIQDVLGEKSTQFATNLVQVVNQNDTLKNAEPSSVLSAAIMATLLELNLNPSLGHAYIVPFNNKQQDGSIKTMATFMPGYKGLKQLAIRSGQFRSIDTKEVYEGQLVDDDSFIGFHFDWKAKKSETIIGYANRFELLNGFEKILYMSCEQIHAHGKRYSKSYANKYGHWQTNFDGMARKTVTKLNLNGGEAPLSIEMQKALTFDASVVKINEEDHTMDADYVDATGQDHIEEPVQKPLLTDDQLTEAIQSIALDGVPISAITDEFEVTADQLAKLEEASKGK